MSEQNVEGMLEDFEAAAKAVQDSLLSRDTELIWVALAWQERSMDQVNAMFKEHAEVWRDAIDSSPALQQILKRSQSLVHSNRTLTNRFLNVIDQTFARLGRGSSRTYAGYEGSSRVAPLLVSQQG